MKRTAYLNWVLEMEVLDFNKNVELKQRAYSLYNKATLWETFPFGVWMDLDFNPSQ